MKHGFNIEWSRKKSTSSEIGKLIYGFLVTIPSDKHIMGVKTIHDGDDEDEEEDEFMNIWFLIWVCTYYQHNQQIFCFGQLFLLVFLNLSQNPAISY